MEFIGLRDFRAQRKAAIYIAVTLVGVVLVYVVATVLLMMVK